jgi:hypothetical protein
MLGCSSLEFEGFLDQVLASISNPGPKPIVMTPGTHLSVAVPEYSGWRPLEFYETSPGGKESMRYRHPGNCRDSDGLTANQHSVRVEHSLLQ